MKKADNFDAKKWLVENKITFQSRLNENVNNNDLKLYYDILMDVGGEDLAGEYEDIQAKAGKFNSTSDFIKNDLEILSQDDEDQVNDIKTDFVAAKLRKMSPQEFTDFVKEVGDYDFWSDAPNGIDPFNNVGDRMDVLSTNEVEDTNRYFNTLFKSSSMNESRLNEEENSKFDDNAKAYGILFIDNDDEDEIEETPYIWNDEKMEALVMSMGYEDAEEIAGEFTNIFSPGDEDEMGIFRAQENNPKLQPEDLTIGMYKKNIAAEFPKEDEDNDYDLNDAFKAAPSVASYEDVLNIIKSYEDESVLSDFKSKFPEGKPVNKKDYSDFAINLIDDMSEVSFIQANWISIYDEDVYEKAGLI